MEVWFDQVDEKVTNAEGVEITKAKVVYFHMRKSATTQPAEPFTFDGPATERHMREYPAAWEQFQASLKPVEAAKPAEIKVTVVEPNPAVEKALEEAAPELGLPQPVVEEAAPATPETPVE